MFYQVFTEFDAYEDAFQHAQVRMTLHRPERPNWVIGQMNLGRLHLQWGTSGGGMVTEGEILPRGHVLFVPLSNFTTNGVNGCRLSEGSIMVASAGSEFCVSADSWNDWCSLFVPHDVIWNETLCVDQEPLSGCRVVRIGSRRLQRVRQAMRQAIKLASGHASFQPMCANAETMLQQFAESAVTRDQSETHGGRGRPRVDRHGVVRVVKDDLAVESKWVIAVSELAGAAKVSERTLLRIFHDWYGISPTRYARLRQIHIVRDALLAADSRSTTVTAVLIQHDISQFGRFAGVYRSLFGESPSETLCRGRRSFCTRDNPNEHFERHFPDPVTPMQRAHE